MANLTSLFEDFKLNFIVDQNSSTNEFNVIRTTFENAEEVQNFVSFIEKKTNTNYRVNFQKQNLKRIVFHKRWVCQHARFRKKSCSKKNALCNSYIDVVIKKMSKCTRQRDNFLKMEVPLPCIIKINLEHSHSTSNADALRRLDVSPEVKKEFEEYFKNGLAVAEARRLHEDKLIALYDYSSLANSTLNPTHNQVYYLYNKWRLRNFGPICDPFNVLKDKLSSYEDEGVIVKYVDEELWSILIITPVMKRTQQLPCSREIIFLDSTSGCEATSSTFTVFVSATKAGGIPIAILLHPCQTTESYVKAFTLLKTTAPFCFGMQEAPFVFMTDDSAAEKKALSLVWKSSKQFLCHFHVAQAEWRWLISNSSDVLESERQTVMKLFQNVMYADSKEKVGEAVKAVINLEEIYPKFVNRFRKFFERSEEWVKFYRLNTITRHHNTNNMCEAAIRVIKEIVLSRTRAYNVAALVEYIVNVFNKYLIKRLLSKAYHRGVEKKFLYEDLIKKIENSKPENIKQVSENVYLVPSNQINIMYIVDSSIGYCTCKNGKTGAYCKHQFFLMQYLKLQLPNAPCTIAEDRFMLAKIALGSDCPPLSFFEDFIRNKDDSPFPSNKIHDINNLNLKSSTYTNISQDLNLESSTFEIIPVEVNDGNQEDPRSADENASEEDKAAFLHEVNRLMQLPIKKTILNKLTRSIKNIDNDRKLNMKFMKINAVLNTKRKRVIRVQPTAVPRRRKGVSKKNRVIPSGRPNKKVLKEKKKKRKHSLKLNILENIGNSKK